MMMMMLTIKKTEEGKQLHIVLVCAHNKWRTMEDWGLQIALQYEHSLAIILHLDDGIERGGAAFVY